MRKLGYQAIAWREDILQYCLQTRVQQLKVLDANPYYLSRIKAEIPECSIVYRKYADMDKQMQLVRARLGDMFPRVLPDNSIDGTTHNSVFISQLIACGLSALVSVPYFLDQFISQFVRTLSFSFDRGIVFSSAFGNHVMHIIFWATSKQMVRPHTEPIITMMTRQHARRQRPIMQFIRRTMGIKLFAIPTKHAIGWAPFSPRDRTLPKPTAIRFFHIAPETLFKGAISEFMRMATKKAVVFAFNVSLGTDRTLDNIGWVAATACAKGRVSGRMILHVEPPIRCANPRLFAAVRGIYSAHFSILTTRTQVQLGAIQ